FGNDEAELRPISDWFREFARDRGLSESRTLDIELCLNELIVNVINYAYADRGRHEIRLSLEGDAGEIRATIEDDGRPFNPLEKDAPPIPDSLEEAGIGGWGNPPVRGLAHDFSYGRRHRRHRAHLTSREASPLPCSP